MLYVSDSSSQKKWSFVLLKTDKKCSPGYIQKQFISKKDEVVQEAPKEVKADPKSVADFDTIDDALDNLDFDD